jgi:hypothetical protein
MVTNVEVYRDWEMIVAAAKGDVCVRGFLAFLPGLQSRQMRSFDMRFMRTEPGGKTKPLLEFLGHRNAHMNDLVSRFRPISSLPKSHCFCQGFEVLPSGDFVIAAGIDKIVRAWSTKTGERVPIPTQGSPCALLDERPLEDQVLAIRATESNVWHSTGRSVRHFQIGSAHQ